MLPGIDSRLTFVAKVDFNVIGEDQFARNGKMVRPPIKEALPKNPNSEIRKTISFLAVPSAAFEVAGNPVGVSVEVVGQVLLHFAGGHEPVYLGGTEGE